MCFTFAFSYGSYDYVHLFLVCIWFCFASGFVLHLVWSLHLVLSLHLLFCKACRNYTSNNTKLTKLMKQESKDEGFKSKEKTELEELFKQQIERVENN